MTNQLPFFSLTQSWDLATYHSFASQQGLKSFVHPLCANGWCGPCNQMFWLPNLWGFPANASWNSSCISKHPQFAAKTKRQKLQKHDIWAINIRKGTANTGTAMLSNQHVRHILYHLIYHDELQYQCAITFTIDTRYIKPITILCQVVTLSHYQS